MAAQILISQLTFDRHVRSRHDKGIRPEPDDVLARLSRTDRNIRRVLPVADILIDALALRLKRHLLACFERSAVAAVRALGKAVLDRQRIGL